ENHRQNQQMDFKYINTGGKIGTRQNSVTANIIASQQKNKEESAGIDQYNYANNHAQNTYSNHANNEVRKLNFSSNFDLYGANSSPNMSVYTKGDNAFWKLISYGLQLNSDINEQY